ncbi:MAG: hypothetical protein ACRBBJ_03625 [Rhodomicrobiaceae bacterium]|jgi:hypothetical protein
MFLEKKQEIEIRATIASLYFLAKEAEAIGLTDLSNIIRSSINDIDEWLNGNNKVAFEMIVENDLFHLLDFMHNFSNKEKFEIICDLLLVDNTEFKQDKSKLN